MNITSMHLHDHLDIELDLAQHFDVFSQTTLDTVYQEHERNHAQFYIACVIDEHNGTLITEASEIARWYLNFQQAIVPTNCLPIQNFAIYQLDFDSKKFKFFCDRLDLVTKPFFACLIASNDPHLEIAQLAKVYKILANCYHFGKGGAPSDGELAHVYATQYLELMGKINAQLSQVEKI